jgi:hypothetical protein
MTQRNRVNINYTTRKLKLYGALQEIHLWGVDKKFSAVGSINAFELYAEPSLGKDWKLRVGREGKPYRWITEEYFQQRRGDNRADHTKESVCYSTTNLNRI